MTLDDPYDVLGVPRNATDAEVGRAYRREVRRHHPDSADGDTSDDERRCQLARVQAAYVLLRDAVRREEYDRRRSVVAPPPAAAVPVTVVVRPTGPTVVAFPTRPPEPPLRAGPVRWER